MWNDKIDEQTIALAGLYQSCEVVSKIAWKGEYVEKDLIPLINCILKINSTNTEDVYMNITSLETGLIHFRKQIVGDIFTRSSETRRYIASLKQLSYNLMQDHKCINEIQYLIKKCKLKIDSELISPSENIPKKNWKKEKIAINYCSILC